MEQTDYDVTIIGGGPAGLFAAFYCGLHQLRAQLIEALPEVGGQPATLYPEKKIWDVAGIPGVTGAQLTRDLTAQLALAPVDQVLGQRVTNVVKEADGRLTVTTTQRTTTSRAVVIALGNGAFTPRKLALPGADSLTGKQVHYFATHKADFEGQRVAVLGGGDAAVDLALMLEPVAKSVQLVHRRNQFRALPLTVQQLEESAVEKLTPYLPRELRENPDGSVTLTLKKMRAEEELPLTVDKVLVSYGFTANNAALDEWALPLESERGKIKVDSTMATSVAGVYAIGDCATYPGKTPLIATGFGEAPRAITSLAKLLYPEKRLATHSSSMHLDGKGPNQ